MRRIAGAVLSAVAAMLLTAGVARATTASEEKVTCPVCGTTCRAMRITSTNTFGGQDRDFLRRARGAQTVLLLPVTCPKCLYSGYIGDFKEPVEEKVKQKILAGKALVPPKHAPLAPGDEGRRALTEGLEPKGTKRPAWARHDLVAQTLALKGAPKDTVAFEYLAAAWSVRFEENPFARLMESSEKADRDWLNGLDLGADREGLGNPAANEITVARALLKRLDTFPKERRRFAALCAAWLLRTHGEHEALLRALPAVAAHLDKAAAEALVRSARASVELERGYQRKARAIYVEMLAAAKMPNEGERPVLTYLVGELSRRLGEPAMARAYFDRVAALEKAPEWLRTWSREQKALLPPPK